LSSQVQRKLAKPLVVFVGVMVTVFVVVIGWRAVMDVVWDHRIPELCRDEGGVTAIAPVRLSADDHRRWKASGHRLPEGFTFKVTETAVVKPDDASIERITSDIVRLDNQDRVATLVTFIRASEKPRVRTQCDQEDAKFSMDSVFTQ
jgi:hypothetical protein